MPGRGHLPAQIEGKDGIFIDGALSVQMSASGLSSGSFQRLPALRTTNSLVAVSFWSAPFTLAPPTGGDTLFQMTAQVFLTSIGNAIMGAFFSANVDGIPILDSCTIEEDFDPGPTELVTAVRPAIYIGLMPGLATGEHTLNIFWQVFHAACTAQVAGPPAPEANLQIRRL